jgi:hypothetical protein
MYRRSKTWTRYTVKNLDTLVKSESTFVKLNKSESLAAPKHCMKQPADARTFPISSVADCIGKDRGVTVDSDEQLQCVVSNAEMLQPAKIDMCNWQTETKQAVGGPGHMVVYDDPVKIAPCAFAQPKHVFVATHNLSGVKEIKFTALESVPELRVPGSDTTLQCATTEQDGVYQHRCKLPDDRVLNTAAHSVMRFATSSPVRMCSSSVRVEGDECRGVSCTKEAMLAPIAFES